MKKLMMIGTIAMISLFTACRDNNSQQQHDQMQHGGGQHADVYQCPMKDEGDKTYDKPGNCPKCGMELKKLE